MKLKTLTTQSASSDLLQAIESALPGADVEVTSGQPGHFSLSVTAAQFQGKSPLSRQREVYRAIAHLMRGDGAPVHAIDQLRTQTP
jgi:acid stress-induced BolA-like protein IbaG/YrbA